MINLSLWNPGLTKKPLKHVRTMQEDARSNKTTLSSIKLENFAKEFIAAFHRN